MGQTHHSNLAATEPLGRDSRACRPCRTGAGRLGQGHVGRGDGRCGHDCDHGRGDDDGHGGGDGPSSYDGANQVSIVRR
jgi:hypothetical protein